MIQKFTLFLLTVLLFNSGEAKSQEIQNSKKEPTEPIQTEIWKPRVPVVSPGVDNRPPSDAIVLFDGTNFDEWIGTGNLEPVKWILNNDGSMTVKNQTGNIQTKKKFGSMQLHIEWKSPKEIQGRNQSRGNSGVFIQEKYEVQVLDNNNNDTYVNGQVGSIYKQSIPLVMAASPTGDWNIYDIIYHAPEFDSNGNKTISGTITLLHNGILVQDHYKIKGSTEYIGWPKNISHGKASLMLQDHGDNSRVSYRNIWLRELE